MKLLVALTAHGLGHLGQVAPVLQRLNAADLTVATTLPGARVAEVLEVPHRYEHRQLDVGMRNLDAIKLERAATLEAYAAFHRNYDLEEEVAWLRGLAPDLVLSDVPYRIAEASARVGIPCVGLCSLNWADVLEGTFGAVPWVPRIREAYAQMTLFLKTTPAMEMPQQPRTRQIGLVARVGRPVRDRLPAGKLALVSMGGVPVPPPERWPRIPGVTWLLPPGWPGGVDYTRLGVRFIDLMASVDLMVTKPGYGTFAEAAAHGLPVLSVRLPRWPEEPCLWEFLARRGGLRELTREELESGRFAPSVERLLEEPRPEPMEPTGVQEAVEQLHEACQHAG